GERTLTFSTDPCCRLPDCASSAHRECLGDLQKLESGIILARHHEREGGVHMEGISGIATRRRFLQAAAMLAGSAAVAACSAPAPATAPQQPAPAPKPAPTEAAAAKPADQSPASQAPAAK